MTYKAICAALLGWGMAAVPSWAGPSWSFAIVVDPQSAVEAAAELRDYAAAIERTDGMKVHTLVDRWGVPDSIRNVLHRLYLSPEAPLCGAVFVGDIPVPMVRDAQHLTSAFKMDQRLDRRESSVPSDRYYDDFDLVFTPQGHDEGTPYYYYSLRGEGAQQLQSDLFTGRIRPTDSPASSRYEKLRRYLRKAVAAKQEENRLDQVFYFTGNGSLNESKVAAIDEKLTYYEQFPWLSQQEHVRYLDHSQAPSVKVRLMNELMRPDLDFSVLHHHGSPDIQYLNATPSARTVEASRELILFRLREQLGRMTKVENTDSLYQALADKYQLPLSWIDEARDPAARVKDSLAEQALNLTLADFDTYAFAPNSRMVVLDACFNASFHLDNSIANAYIFSPGATVAVVGGTVNLLQDKWYNRFAGLLGAGMYAGYFNLFQNYLESHLIGDPTFRFTPAEKLESVNTAIAQVVTRRSRHWSLSGAGWGDLEALQLELRYRNGRCSGSELLTALEQSPHSQVRLEALHLLSQLRGEYLVRGLQIAVHDRNEMVQRFAVNYIGSNGDPRLAGALISLFLQDNASERVAFNVERMMMYFPKEVLLAEFNRQIEGRPRVDAAAFREAKTATLLYNANRWEKEVRRLFDPDLKESSFDFIAACLRLYCPHNQVPEVLRYIRTTPDETHQIKLLEALGWMPMSYNAPLIAAAAREMSEDPRLSPAVRHEALKTYHRVR